jgi:ADP-L-glycero-D-manno-heptose 6-epimerase
MKFLVTGASGFIGYNLTKTLIKLGHTVYTTCRPMENPYLGNRIGHNFQDIEIPEIDCLFHLAANADTTCTDKITILNNNCYEAVDFFKKVLDKGCKKIVYASSGAVYGNVATPFREDGPVNPLNYYAESKLLLDESVKDLPVVGLRFSNVFGPYEDHKGKMASMISQMYLDAIFRRPIKLFKWGDQARDWVSVNDVVRACLQSVNSMGIYNIGAGFAKSFNDLAVGLGTTWISYIDNPHPEAYQENTLHDITKAQRDFNYSPNETVEILQYTDY